MRLDREISAKLSRSCRLIPFQSGICRQHECEKTTGFSRISRFGLDILAFNLLLGGFNDRLANRVRQAANHREIAEYDADGREHPDDRRDCWWTR